jgi:hypothetical protein
VGKIATISFIVRAQLSLLSACVIIKVAMDSICTIYLRIQVDISFLYFQLWAVRSLFRRLALLLGHDLAVPDMLILYHTLMDLGRALLAWEDRLQPLFGVGLYIVISYSDSSDHIIFPPNTAGICCSVQTRGARS